MTFEPISDREYAFCQCTLIRKTANGKTVRVAWIPVKFAVKGNTLRLRDGKTWTDGWLIYHVGAKQTRTENSEQWGLCNRHRKTTDVPKGTFRKL